MKKIFFIIATSLLLFSCGKSNQFIIEGTVADPAYDDSYVYLKDKTNGTPVDSALIKDGKFTFKGEADIAQIYMVDLDKKVHPDKWVQPHPVLLEPGEIVINYDSVFTVTGTEINDAYDRYQKQIEEASTEFKNLYKEYQNLAVQDKEKKLTKEQLDELKKLELRMVDAYEKMEKTLTNLGTDFAKNHIDNGLGQITFETIASSLPPEQQREILELADDQYKSTESAQKIITRLQNMGKVAIGKPFVDFTLLDPEDNEVSLSDYAGKGKYVLVDFWAAWCGPCRQEMPNVVEAYQKYKDKGFEIVGVSLDRDKESWTKGLKDLNMTWPQMSDLKFWDSKVTSLYAITGIPHTVLLDKDGTIIGKDLRGEELQNKLAELMP